MSFFAERTTKDLEAERERLDEQVRLLNADIREINSELYRRSEDYARLRLHGQRSIDAASKDQP